MTCNPSQTGKPLGKPLAVAAERDRIRQRAENLLAHHGLLTKHDLLTRKGAPIAGGRSSPAVGEIPADATCRDAALATALMDLFRRTSAAEVFDCLVRWVGPQLYSRIRSRLRSLGAQYDPHEILQDTIVNIYRYPDRFLASRPGAFAAWSSTIVDNAIRRHLRGGHKGADVAISAPELLQEQADLCMREPSLQAQDHEEWAATASAYALLLQYYLAAFGTLSERERFVLQMVEVRRMRYHELATVLGIRPEALKMVVFRARKRVCDRVGGLLSPTHRSDRRPMPQMAMA